MKQYNPIKRLLDKGVTLYFDVKVFTKDGTTKVISTMTWDKNYPNDYIQIEETTETNETTEISTVIERHSAILANRACRKYELPIFL